jgi:ferrous iron transport protein B
VIWSVIKLTEGDPEVTEEMRQHMPVSVWNEVLKLLAKHEDALRAIVGGRYGWIEEVTRAALSRFKIGQVLLTDRLDHVLTRPVFGVPILLGILAFVFTVTFTIGFPLQKLLESAVVSFGHQVESSLSGAPLRYTDGHGRSFSH